MSSRLRFLRFRFIVSLGVIALMLPAVAVMATAGTWTQVGGDIDGEASTDLSGWSVAMSGDGNTVAIGALDNDGNGLSSGHVRVYELVAGTWTQVGGDIDGEAIGDQSGSSLAMSSDGDTVAIGAIGNDGNGSDSGHVRVYELVAGTWTPVGGDIDGEAAGDWSGYSVAMSSDGSTVAIGAILNDGNGDRSGHVRVYSLRSQNEPPIVDAGGPYNGDEGSAIALSGATATDPDSDPLTLSWAVDAPLVCSFSDDTALNPDLTCDDDGTYTVTLTADDGTAAPVSDDATVTVDNVAPTATFGDDGPVDEGTSFNLSLTSPEDPSGADTTAGFTYAFDCGDGGGLGAFSASSTAVCTTDDNGVRNVKGQIKDKDGDSTEYTDTVTVHNVAPTADSITVPTAPVDVGAQGGATVDVVFSDPAGVNDEDYTCEFDMDFDGVSVTVDQTETGVAYNTCSTTLNYAEPGVYTVKVIVTDKDGDSGMAAATEFIVIYDPDGGFVTGGGWIDSPAGAYVADPTLTGKANFGFVSKYKKGASVPTGSTEFQFKAGDLNFHSGSYDWLVIAGQDKAKYKGTGTINGTGNYGFMLTAVDNGNSGDTFRIKIWDKDNGDAVVYDNKSNSGDDDYDGTVISGGNIKVHT